MNSRIISIGLLLAALMAPRQAAATVTAQGWWHLDTPGNPADVSGNARNFQSAFSTAPNAGGTFGALVIPSGVGGPLDGTGYASTNCVRLGLGVGGRRQSSTWNTGYVPPSTNYGIEFWVLPQDNGIAGGTPTWIVSSGGGVIGSGPAGGVVVRLFDNGDGTSSLRPGIITGPNSAQVVSFGDGVLADTNRWMHLAIVNDNADQQGGRPFFKNRGRGRCARSLTLAIRTLTFHINVTIALTIFADQLELAPDSNPDPHFTAWVAS